MLRLRDIMTKDVLTVSPEMSLRDAMAMLATRHVSGAPVVDAGQVVGVISSTDLLEVAASEPNAPVARAHAASATDDLTVAAVMTRAVVSLRPGTPVTQAAHHMRRAGVHRVLVMHGYRLLGIVTTKDIANAVADNKLTERKYISLPHEAVEAPGWQ